MRADTSDSARSCVVQQLCGGSREAIERMLQFGRELQQDSEQLKRDTASCEAIKKSLKVRAIMYSVAGVEDSQ